MRKISPLIWDSAVYSLYQLLNFEGAYLKKKKDFKGMFIVTVLSP